MTSARQQVMTIPWARQVANSQTPSAAPSSTAHLPSTHAVVTTDNDLTLPGLQRQASFTEHRPQSGFRSARSYVQSTMNTVPIQRPVVSSSSSSNTAICLQSPHLVSLRQSQSRRSSASKSHESVGSWTAVKQSVPVQDCPAVSEPKRHRLSRCISAADFLEEEDWGTIKARRQWFRSVSLDNSSNGERQWFSSSSSPSSSNAARGRNSIIAAESRQEEDQMGMQARLQWFGRSISLSSSNAEGGGTPRASRLLQRVSSGELAAKVASIAAGVTARSGDWWQHNMLPFTEWGIGAEAGPRAVARALSSK